MSLHYLHLYGTVSMPINIIRLFKQTTRAFPQLEFLSYMNYAYPSCVLP